MESIIDSDLQRSVAGSRADIAVMRRWWKMSLCDRVWSWIDFMRLCNFCECVIVSVSGGWEIYIVGHIRVAGVAVRTYCIASRVCEVRARLICMFGRVRVMSVVFGKTLTLGLPMSRGGVVCFTGWGELREGCSCWCRVDVSDACISFHRCAKVFWLIRL